RQSPVTVRGDLDVVAGNLQDAAETLGKVPIVFDDQDPMRPGARFRGDRCWRLQLRCSVEQRQANDELGAATATLTARFYSPTVGRDQAAHQSQAETQTASRLGVARLRVAERFEQPAGHLGFDA